MSEQIPEELILQLMQQTGMTHRDVEALLAKQLHEMTQGPIFKAQTSGSNKRKGPRPQYSETDYPHFLERDEVKKYTLRVTLKDITPPIWRKFQCPSNISLRHLTELILRLFEWENTHLNQITAGNGIYQPFYQRDEGYEGYGRALCFNQEDYTISDILQTKNKIVRFEYDFGDSWMHEIRLSSIDEYQDGEPHDIRFVGGKRQGPPEDCGGVFGYAELLKLHKERNWRTRLTKEEKENLEWYGIMRDYDPEYIDIEDCEALCERFGTDGGGKKHARGRGARMEIVPDIKMSPTFDEVLQRGFAIRDVEPWEDLNDSDAFVVRMQDGTDMYVVVMGHGGEEYEIQLYDGREMFDTYLSVVQHGLNRNIPDFEIQDFCFWMNYMTLDFVDSGNDYMPPEVERYIDEQAAKYQIDLGRHHSYPLMICHRPHLMPAVLQDEASLLRVKETLEAVEWLSRELLRTEELTTLGFSDRLIYPNDKGGKKVPLIVKAGEGDYKVERTTLPGTLNNYEVPVLTDAELQPLLLLPKSGSYYCRMLHLPGTVQDENSGEEYCSLILLRMNKNTGTLDMPELCGKSDTPLRDLLVSFIDLILKTGTLPQRIATDNPRTEALLRDFCRRLGIILVLKRTRIPELTEFCNDFLLKIMEIGNR